MFEEACLEGVPSSSRPSAPLVQGHSPDRAHQLDGYERQLQGLNLVIWLTTLAINRGDPPPYGVIDTRIGHQEVVSLLDAQRLIIDQHLNSLPPEPPIDIEAEVVHPNLPILAHCSGALTEPEDALETGGLDGPPMRLAQDDLWRHIEDTPLRVGTLMGPVAPKLVVGHEPRMLLIHVLPLRTTDDVRIQHPALDGKAAFGQVLPRVALRDRRPLDRQLLKTGLQRHEHRPMITDDALRGTPPGDRLAEDLAQPREVLAVEAPDPHKGTAVAVEDQDAVQPLAIDVNEVAQVGEPDLMRGSRLVRPFVRVRRARLARGRDMGLFVERDHLPDGGVAIAVAQRV